MSDGVNIITEPTVYLVGKQIIIQPELTQFLEDHDFANWTTDSPSDPETLVEVAARTCYQSFKGGRGHAEHIKHLLEVGHGSTCEHAVWNLLITGVSRSLTHELVRHRAGWAYSQLSQRYVDESVAEYVEPDIIASDPELHEIWLECVKNSHAAYMELADRLTQKLKPPTPVDCPVCEISACKSVARHDRDGLLRRGWECVRYDGGGCTYRQEWVSETDRRKAARQAARSVLPNATETKIFVTLNARAGRHFLEQRGSQHAEPEIRKLANAMLEVLAKDSPNLFGDYERHPLPDGTFEIKTRFPKV